MRNICIIHFQPVEKYPPAFNLLDEMMQNLKDDDHLILITSSIKGGKKIDFKTCVTEHRLAYVSPVMTRFSRLWVYLKFNWNSLRLLLKYRPSRILYFETMSSGSPWIYKLFFNNKASIFLHYHEYVSPKEYKEGMLVNRWLHQLELINYWRADWISQTNPERREFFLKDCGHRVQAISHILPNHPPGSWPGIAEKIVKRRDGKTGFVYVGAIDLKNMFCREMAHFIACRPDLYFWDVFSDNFSQEVIEFFSGLQATNIHFKGAIPYHQLPEILPLYDVGLVLYKGHIPNYIYNIPNKLYEYHVCGLDTWFPAKMISSLSLITIQTYPKIKSVNFEKLEASAPDLLSHVGLEYKKQSFTCRNAAAELIAHFFNSTN